MPLLSQSIIHTLLHAARGALHHAHAPYSRFQVGAAVLTHTGHIYTGCNMETSTGDQALCAERVAIGNAVTCGAAVAEQRFICAVAVSMPHPASQESCHLNSPCGACRQVIQDFARAGETIIILDDGKEGIVLQQEALLPHAFSLTRATPAAQQVDLAALEQAADVAMAAQQIAAHSASHVMGHQGGAIIRTRSGRQFAGVMVENSCTPLTLNPLQCAVGRAVAAGEAREDARFVTHITLCLPRRAATQAEDNQAALVPAFMQEFCTADCVVNIRS